MQHQTDRVAGAMKDIVPAAGLLDHSLRGRIHVADALAHHRRRNGSVGGLCRNLVEPRLLVAGPAAKPGALILDIEPVQARQHQVDDGVASADPCAASGAIAMRRCRSRPGQRPAFEDIEILARKAPRRLL